MAVTQTLTLTQVSQNIAANTSQVRILWQSTQTGVTQYNAQKKATWWTRTNGGAWTAYYVYYTLPQNQTVTIVDTTVTVPHDSAGNCVLDVSTEMNTNTQTGTVKLDKSLTLTQIPRYSTLTATDADIGSISTIHINKQSPNFKHCLRYSLTGGAPWTYIDAAGAEASREVIFSDAKVSFQIPQRFYYSIPNAKSGTCTLELWTYISDTAYLPEPKRTTFTYRAVPEVCSPTIGCVATDVNEKTLALTGDGDTLVRYQSDARLRLIPGLYPGADITDETRDICLQYLGQWHYGFELHLPGVQVQDFKLWVRDSRGYATYGDYSHQKFIPYVRLTNATQFRRPAPTGSIVEVTVSGDYYSGSFGGVNNLENTLSVQYRTADTQQELETATWQDLTPVLTDTGYRAEVSFDDIPYDQTRWIQTRVTDRLETAEQTALIGRGLPVFDWGQNDFRFNVPVEVPALTVGGVALKDYIKNVMGG